MEEFVLQDPATAADAGPELPTVPWLNAALTRASA